MPLHVVVFRAEEGDFVDVEAEKKERRRQLGCQYLCSHHALRKKKLQRSRGSACRDFSWC